MLWVGGEEGGEELEVGEEEKVVNPPEEKEDLRGLGEVKEEEGGLIIEGRIFGLEGEEGKNWKELEEGR